MMQLLGHGAEALCILLPGTLEASSASCRVPLQWDQGRRPALCTLLPSSSGRSMSAGSAMQR